MIEHAKSFGEFTNEPSTVEGDFDVGSTKGEEEAKEEEPNNIAEEQDVPAEISGAEEPNKEIETNNEQPTVAAEPNNVAVELDEYTKKDEVSDQNKRDEANFEQQQTRYDASPKASPRNDLDDNYMMVDEYTDKSIDNSKKEDTSTSESNGKEMIKAETNSKASNRKLLHFCTHINHPPIDCCYCLSNPSSK